MVTMKRAVFICLAALLVFLAYPSTQSLAKDSDLSDKPAVLSPKDANADIALAGEGDGSGGGGDADDLAGIRRGTRTVDIDVSVSTSAATGFRTFLQVWWWNFMVMLR